jgi:hypothetical protein
MEDMEQVISFSNVNGEIYLQYANCESCELLKEFQNEMESFQTIKITTKETNYVADNAYIDVARHLWKMLGNTPTDDDGVDGNIDDDFLHFEKGDSVYDIWHWFESEFKISVAKDLMGV